MGLNDSILFDNPSYDDSIVGISTKGNLIYSFDKMVNEFGEENPEMSIEEILDFIGYNTIRALDYMSEEKKPIIIHMLEDFYGNF